MQHSQYMRIEALAGGLGASKVRFVRACHELLSAQGRTRAMRDIRHQWIREGLSLRSTLIS
jgi:hypothetical protein